MSLLLFAPSEVNRILGTVDELQETAEEMITPFYVGESVKVIFGPFSGFSGLIEEVHTEKKKLKVMVMIFGRKTPARTCLYTSRKRVVGSCYKSIILL